MTETFNLTLNYSSFADGGRDIVAHMPVLPSMLLLFEFFLILLLGITGSKRASGTSNAAMWMSIAGLVTSTSAFLLYSVEGLVSIETIGVCLAVTIGSVLWYFVSSPED